MESSPVSKSARITGWIMTILLGIGGSLLAGLVTSRGSRDFHRAGCLASIIGAMVLIFIGRYFHLHL